MPLINCEINLDLNQSKTCVIVVTDVADQGATFSITDTELYILVVTLSTQDNAKLFEQLKSGFKRAINWNKYQSQISTERWNQCLDYLIHPSFQGVNRLFVLSFEDEAQRTSYKQCYLPTVEIKSYNVMIDGQKIFDQPVRHNPMNTSSSNRYQFNIEIHRRKLLIFHRLWKANPCRKDDTDSTWIIPCRFDLQNRWNIDEFSTWIFRCRLDVEST